MSWANKEPEKYDELTRQGILNYLYRAMHSSSFMVPNDCAQGYEALVEVIQTTPDLRGVYVELQRLASVDILKAEQDWFGGQIDDAMGGR